MSLLEDVLLRYFSNTLNSAAIILFRSEGGACLTNQDPNIHVQIVATPASTHFYTQAAVDAAVRSALESSNDNNNDLHSRTNGLQIDTNDIKDPNVGVRVWQDADEWSHWRKVGDPILHIELRRWADLVVVAPCSADILAKIAGGLSENLAVSLPGF